MKSFKDQVYYVVGCNGSSCMFDSAKLPATMSRDERLRVAYELSDRIKNAGFTVAKYGFLDSDQYSSSSDLPF